MQRRSALGATLILMFLIALSTSRIDEAQAAALDVRFEWKTYPIERGAPSAMTVTAINKEAQLLQLFFVGLGFDWMPKDTFFYSPESSTPRNMTQYASVSFDIGFSVPEDVKPGFHEARVIVDWAKLAGDTWNRTAIVYLIPNVEIVVKSQQGGLPLSTTTIAIIIIIGAILLLERRRIQAVIGKRIKKEAKPKKPPEELE